MSSYSWRCRRVPIERVLADRGVLLRRCGRRLVGPCPVHGGDNPRAFTVDPDRNLWFCFTRCRSGGDVIDLVQRLDHCAARQAMQSLAALAEIAPFARRSSRASSASGSFRPYTRTLRLDPNVPFLSNKGISPQTAKHFEVGAYTSIHGFLAGCLGVRLQDVVGHPLGYAGRRLDPDEVRLYGKWKLPRGLPKSSLLYGYHRVADQLASTNVVLVEGPWAVLRLAQLGVPAIALLGLHLSAAQARLLEPALGVVVMLDGDQAGRDAAQDMSPHVPSFVALRHPPADLDPDDLDDTALAALIHPFFSL